MDSAPTALPRVTIQFCTQCKWMLRAAYFGQELLSTFGTALGEVALQPSTGGTFIVDIYHASLSAETSSDGTVRIERHVLWNRKDEGGFPETKELKKRVRDIIDPGRDLGHVDGKKKSVAAPSSVATEDTESVFSNQASSTAASTIHGDEDSQPSEGPRPKAITRLTGGDGGSVTRGERKFTPMDVDIAEARGRVSEQDDGIKRNDDGSICEDCN